MNYINEEEQVLEFLKPYKDRYFSAQLIADETGIAKLSSKQQ